MDELIGVTARAAGIDERLKVAKGKLRMKKAMSARLVDGGADLNKGDVRARRPSPPPSLGAL